jgi:hypothetical protein
MEYGTKQVAQFYQELAARYPGIDIRVSQNGVDVGYLNWLPLRGCHEYFIYIAAPCYIDAADMQRFNVDGVHPMPGMEQPTLAPAPVSKRKKV